MTDDQTLFDHAVAALQGEVANAAFIMTNDPLLRQQYQRMTAAITRELQQKVAAHQLTWAQAARQAHALRNDALDVIRLRSTPVGRAMAEQIKSKGKTLNELIARYTLDRYGPDARFDALSAAQKNQVYGEVVKAAGRPDKKFSAKALRWLRYGRGLIVLSLAVSVYNVVTSDTPVETAGHEGAIIGAGIGGGIAGGALAGLACGPGAPACVTIGAFVGGALAAFGVDWAL